MGLKVRSPRPPTRSHGGVLRLLDLDVTNARHSYRGAVSNDGRLALRYRFQSTVHSCENDRRHFWIPSKVGLCCVASFLPGGLKAQLFGLLHKRVATNPSFKPLKKFITYMITNRYSTNGLEERLFDPIY